MSSNHVITITLGSLLLFDAEIELLTIELLINHLSPDLVFILYRGASSR